MNSLYKNILYQEELKYISELELPWDELKNSVILISGASGLIGSFLTDSIMKCNEIKKLNCKVYAVSRNIERMSARFEYYKKNEDIELIKADINEPLNLENIVKADYVIHLASNTHPLSYAQDPIGTVTANVIGLNNMLRFAVEKKSKRFVFASSNEIYGENRGDVELFSEDYCGYINSNTMRAGYPESKRCGEALCQAYIKQEKLDVVIPRLTRTYGPTMIMSDSKASSQFIKRGIMGEDIVLKSRGTQYYSYTYAADAVAGLLTVMLKGEMGEAYNVADESGDIRLKDLAELIADIAGTKVIYELPDEVEKSGYSMATKARLDGSKLRKLGWTARYDIESGIKRTLSMLNEHNMGKVR